jgi:hypothetical protein
MAKGPVERAAAFYLLKTKSQFLNQTTDLAHREFLFRCVYVPLYSLAIIRYGTVYLGVPPLLLHQYAAYNLAFERLLLEIIFVRKLHRIKKKDRPKKLTDFFIKPPGGYAVWQRRFEEWRASIIKSHAHFMSKQAPDIKHGGATALSAHLGNILSQSHNLPLNLVGDMITRIENDKKLFNVLMKNALKPKPARWGEPELDTWLIEIWPIVRMYGWNYPDVWQVAVAKWEDECEEKESFGGVEKIEDRCKKMLGLQLGPKGQARGGRTKTPKKPLLPLLRRFAASIKSIGMEKEKWILGGSISEIIAPPKPRIKSESKVRAKSPNPHNEQAL